MNSSVTPPSSGSQSQNEDSLSRTGLHQTTQSQEQPPIEDSVNEPGICPSCGTTVGDNTVCPNCGTSIDQVSVSSPAFNQSSSTNIEAEPLKSLDQILLERFEQDPPETSAKRLPFSVIAIVLVAILAVAFIMWTVTKKEEVFAEGRTEAAHGEHHEGDGHDHGMSAADSAKLQEQLAILNTRIDSLEHHLSDNPSDDSARVNLAIAFSIKGDYPRAKEVYEAHLKRNPNDADARVDYASVIIETTNDPRAGMAELEQAIKIDPKNPKALFNAAILALQLREDHMSGFAKSREYLKRAKEASLKDNPTFASQIDMLIAEMDKKEADIKAAKDSATGK